MKGKRNCTLSSRNDGVFSLLERALAFFFFLEIFFWFVFDLIQWKASSTRFMLIMA